MHNSLIRWQEHTIRLQGWTKIEKVQLHELFQDYPWVEQIIRFRENICEIVEKLLRSRDVHLFNTTDPLNDYLLIQYERNQKSTWLLSCIDEQRVIQEESLKVVQVDCMRNIPIVDIKAQWLLSKSISAARSIDELLSWLGTDFYWQEARLEVDSLMFRSISL